MIHETIPCEDDHQIANEMKSMLVKALLIWGGHQSVYFFVIFGKTWCPEPRHVRKKSGRFRFFSQVAWFWAQTFSDHYNKNPKRTRVPIPTSSCCLHCISYTSRVHVRTDASRSKLTWYTCSKSIRIRLSMFASFA